METEYTYIDVFRRRRQEEVVFVFHGVGDKKKSSCLSSVLLGPRSQSVCSHIPYIYIRSIYIYESDRVHTYIRE